MEWICLQRHRWEHHYAEQLGTAWNGMEWSGIVCKNIDGCITTLTLTLFETLNISLDIKWYFVKFSTLVPEWRAMNFWLQLDQLSSREAAAPDQVQRSLWQGGQHVRGHRSLGLGQAVLRNDPEQFLQERALEWITWSATDYPTCVVFFKN